VNFRILAMPLSVVKAKITASTGAGSPKGFSRSNPPGLLAGVAVGVGAGVGAAVAVVAGAIVAVAAEAIVAVGVPGPGVGVGVTVAGMGLAVAVGIMVGVGVGCAPVGERLPRKANAASARLMNRAKRP
jgi:hypothetical protein